MRVLEKAPTHGAMEILSGLQQGSDLWKKIRLTCNVASEAPVVMADSKHKSRQDLLRLKTLGGEEVHSEWMERYVFAKGHEAEDSARFIAEEVVGEDLYPEVGVRWIGGVKYLASFDGLTLARRIIWEHKWANDELYNAVANGLPLDPHYYWQLEHQLLVNPEAEEVLFSVSNGTRERYVDCVYRSRPEARIALIAGWQIFIEDLLNYQMENDTATAAPEIEALPGVYVEIEGKVLASNLDVFREQAIERIKSIAIAKIETDEDLAYAKAAVKFCEQTEEKLQLAKQRVIGQVSSIDDVVRTIDAIHEEFRTRRLALSRLATKGADEVKLGIIVGARDEFRAYLDAINEGLEPLAGDARVLLRVPDPDIASAIKGRRSFTAMRAAAKNAVAKAKIRVATEAGILREKLELINHMAGDQVHLFIDDKQALCALETPALAAVVLQRVRDHDHQLAPKPARETPPPPSPPAPQSHPSDLPPGLPGEIFVVVTERDGATDGEPIVHECYVQKATREVALEHVRRVGDKYGRVWLARLEIVEEIDTRPAKPEKPRMRVRS